MTSVAVAFSGVAAAHAEGGQGNGQGKPPAHSQAGGKSKAPENPGRQGERGHQGDPGHQGNRGHQGNPGHQGSNGGNQGTPGGPVQPPAGDAPPKPQTPGDHVNGAGHNPPGNNGTIKIEQLSADGTPQNNPHQSCQLRVEWYGFDEGKDVVSRVSFDAQAPTAGSKITVAGDKAVPVGGDPASGAGTDTGLDGSEVYTLSFTGEPHPQQGYHVKVTVHTPYSLGNDSKSKVFWMEPCTGGGSSGGTVIGAVPTRPDVQAAGGVTGTLPSTTGAGQEPRTDEGAGSDSGSVPVPTEVDAGSNDSDGVRNAVPFGLLALGSAVAAAVVQLRRRASLR